MWWAPLIELVAMAVLLIGAALLVYFLIERP